MLLNEKMEELIEAIYADSDVSPAEIMALRNAVNEAEEKVLGQVGYESMTHALFRSFEVTGQLLQETALKIRQDDNTTDFGRAVVFAALEANVALLQATLKAFAE